MTFALEVNNLKKRYHRSSPWVIDDLTCHVPKGSVCALIGPNGAGKTTLYSIIAGFLLPDEGKVDLLSQGTFDPWKHRGKVGVLPQDATLDPRMTCLEFLHYMGTLQGCSYLQAKREANIALDKVNLLERAHHKISSLSHGMHRRVATASALLGNPELILLDEPMSGLDPAQAHSLRSTLLQKKGDATLIISSHNLTELERICDWVIILEQGTLIAQGNIEEITKGKQSIRWELGSGFDAVQQLITEKLPNHTFHYKAQINGGILNHIVPPNQNIDDASLVMAQALCTYEIPIRGCIRGKSLEESFLLGTQKNHTNKVKPF